MHVSPSVSSYMATGLRTACRLDQGNLMRIAAEVRKLVRVHTWMTNPDNIRWGLYHVPKLRTVKDFNKIPEALTILDGAKCEFGREPLRMAH